mmetsp:Transcript_17082/g.25799  ORF Transcript_17082/g.25799 Transcript_17082/m.25799 type:complete len:296 (-) Transcript_17082:454-1341(-)
MHCCCCSSSSSVRASSLHAGEVGLRLSQSLDLLRAGFLSSVEVLEEEVTILMKIGLAVSEGLQLVHGIAQLGLGGDDFLLYGRLFSLTVGDAGLLGHDGVFRSLLQLEVGVLGIALGGHGGLLQVHRVLNDVVQKSNDTTRVAALLVLAEVLRRGLAFAVLLLKQSRRLVARLQDGQGLLQKGLSGLLVGDGGLELGLFLLSVFGGPFHLRVEVVDLLLQGCDRSVQVHLLHVQTVHLGLQTLLGVDLLVGPTLVVVELLDASVAVLRLLLGLLLQLGHQVVDGALHPVEGVELR